MPCYNPLKGYVLGLDSVTGKKIVKVVSPLDDIPGKESFPVPCGHCIGCRLEYSRQWANRCMLEAQYHERSCFVTLTYDDWHVPKRFYGNVADGTALPCYSLDKRDLQLFFKRLRKRFPDCRIRYFGCGEYGVNTLRPHYHIILFGIDFEDKVLSKLGSSKSNQVMYSSEVLDRIWSFPPRNWRGESYFANSPHAVSNAGIATVQPVTWETCAYTARYVTKKLQGPYAKFYEEKNIDPPFCVMSRRPGIGRQYLDDHPDLWDYDYINISTPDGGKKFRPPRYFMKVLEDEAPARAEVLKELRKKMALEQKAILDSMKELTDSTYLHLQEEVKQAQINSLKRSAI